MLKSSHMSDDNIAPADDGRKGDECRVCDNTGWVCENHPDRPWDTLREDSCTCGAGMPCRVCQLELVLEACRPVAPLAAEAPAMLEALRVDVSYMLDAVLSLEAGSNKRTAINLLNERIAQMEAFLACIDGGQHG